MITFKLENADALALVNIIGSLHFQPAFEETLIAQLKAQAPVEEAKVEVEEVKEVKEVKVVVSNKAPEPTATPVPTLSKGK
jgi:hypothetical protein